MIYGYLRVSTDKQDEENQRHEIKQHVAVDEFIAVECSSRKTQKERGITALLAQLKYGDTLVVTELSRLARSTTELLLMVDGFIKNHIGLIAIKQGLKIPANGDKMDAATKTMVTVFGLMAELERDFISDRTKTALKAKKASGIILGKPVGTIQPSILDDSVELIKTMKKEGVSVLAMSKELNCGRSTLLHYIKSRGL